MADASDYGYLVAFTGNRAIRSDGPIPIRLLGKFRPAFEAEVGLTAVIVASNEITFYDSPGKGREPIETLGRDAPDLYYSIETVEMENMETLMAAVNF